MVPCTGIQLDVVPGKGYENTGVRSVFSVYMESYDTPCDHPGQQAENTGFHSGVLCRHVDGARLDITHAGPAGNTGVHSGFWCGAKGTIALDMTHGEML